jgi:hypothetical protein
MNREIRLGKTARGELVTVQIRLEDMDREGLSINHEYVSPLTMQRLSITGTMWQRNHRFRDGDVVSSGQCLDALLDITEPEAPWTLDEIGQLHDLWKRWHLNDMRAGCAHQTVIVYEDTQYGRRVDLAATTAANDCPLNYRYGSAWLYEPLPADVIDTVQRFQRRLEPGDHGAPDG